MGSSSRPHTTVLRELATLMLSVASESVGMMKRSAPERAVTLKPKDEWAIYLEFIKVLFTLADRFSVLHLPIKEQPEFMNSLEDTVADQIKTAMEPILSSGADPMEIVLTIGNAVAESRELYEPFRFLVTEESKEKDACLALLGDRVAEAMGTSENGMVPSAAILCAGAVIPAMKTLFESLATEGALTPGMQAEGEQTPDALSPHQHPGNEIKLVSVMSSIQGEEVETRWGLHPQFRRDLTPGERKELSKLMNRVTQVLGARFAAVAFSETWASWHHPGHA